MDNTFWHPQNSHALFDDLIWSKPEQRDLAGKLAIIGGNSHGFNNVAQAYSAAQGAGVGACRPLLPDSLKKILEKMLPDSEFAACTKSGSFSTKALTDWLNIAAWADATFICGDLGHNSETSILQDRFIEQELGHITLAGDSIDLIILSPLTFLNRDKIMLVPDATQLQRLLIAIRYPTALTSTMTLFQIIDLLHSLTLSYKFMVAYLYEEQALVAVNGEVSSTPVGSVTLTKLATVCTVWLLQQPTNSFKVMTSAVFSLVSQAS